MKSKTVNYDNINYLSLRASVAVDPEEGMVYVGTPDGKINDATIKIFCEGIIKCLNSSHRPPKKMQRELDEIKYYIWNGVLDQYPDYKDRLIKKKKDD